MLFSLFGYDCVRRCPSSTFSTNFHRDQSSPRPRTWGESHVPTLATWLPASSCLLTITGARVVFRSKLMLRTLFWFSEVATGKLLDLAEGANAALTHSGTKQTQSDPFTVHNHATENNNTVWVRREKGWSVRFSCFSLIRRLPCWKWWLSVRVMYCTCCIQRSVFYSRAAAVMKHTIAYWTERALSHNWRGCGAANSITQPPESIEETLCMLMYNK